MLTQLLDLLEQNQSEFDLRALSDALKAEPSAVAGMVQTLVRLGRLEEIGLDCGVCESCGLRQHCDVDVRRAQRYRVPVSRSQ